MRLENVSFRYRRRGPWVLRNVTVSLTPGLITEVTGHNGAGKSTLLRLISGLLLPRRGNVTGRPGEVGYAPERFPTDQPFTVRAYLTHMAAMRRAPRAAITTWAERLAFAHLLDTRLPELSKGTAQKVGLTQALLASPGLLVLDEPFAGLDAATRDDLLVLLNDLAAEGTIIVVSDHQQCLASVTDLARIHVAGATATQTGPPLDRARVPRAAETVSQPPSAHRTTTVIEVVVPAEEAKAALAKLRADGFAARIPDGVQQAGDTSGSPPSGEPKPHDLSSPMPQGPSLDPPRPHGTAQEPSRDHPERSRKGQESPLDHPTRTHAGHAPWFEEPESKKPGREPAHEQQEATRTGQKAAHPGPETTRHGPKPDHTDRESAREHPERGRAEGRARQQTAQPPPPDQGPAGEDAAPSPAGQEPLRSRREAGQ